MVCCWLAKRSGPISIQSRYSKVDCPVRTYNRTKAARRDFLLPVGPFATSAGSLVTAMYVKALQYEFGLDQVLLGYLYCGADFS